ncbi:MAG: DegV family protein [Lachnospiraceae bacterium]|nr:DegV family protein [Lachnospiraceae bacterium]
MKTAVMTDTNSGMMECDAERYGIHMVAMPIIIDEKTYYEGRDIDSAAFFEALYSDKNVSTSQPSPVDVMESWERVLQMGYDEIIYIPMSSGLSESCATAIALSKEYEGKVYVADNHRISVTQWAAALHARKLASLGKTAAWIKETLEQTAYDASIYITVDTLDFLKKGGRITPAVAAIGTALHIKPVLSIQGDKLDSFAMARSMKKGISVMIDTLRKDIETRFGGEDNVIVATAGSGLTQEEKDSYMAEVRKAFPRHQVEYYPLPLSTCVHLGRGAFGVGTYPKYE